MDRRVLLSFILILALLIRMQNFGEIFDSQIYYYEYDPYYHMRLVETIVKEGYRPSYDYYLNYPYGLQVDWLPLFDYLLAFPGILFGMKASEIFAVFFPVILGVLSTLLIYLISLEIIRNEKFAIISAFIYSITPVTVWRSVLGFADHHSWVVFLFLLSIYLLLKPGIWKVLFGVPMLLMAFSWLGTPIYAAILAISSLIHFNVKELRVLAISNLIPAFSFIQNYYMGLSFLAFSIFLLVGSYVKGYENRIKNVTNYYILTSLFCILIAYFTPITAFEFLRSGINYVFGIDTYLSTISEAKSFQILDLIGSSGYLFFVLALVSILMIKNRFLVAFFLLSFVLSLLQLRFAEVLAIPSAILASYTICNILERLEYPIFSKTENREIKMSKAKRAKEKKKELVVTKKDHLIVSAFLLILAAPCIVMSIVSFDLSNDWKNALNWLEENAEEQSYLNAYKKPDYSVLSWWDYGNWILYIAKKAVVCNNFQVGADDAAKFFVAESEEEAMKIIERRGVKFVITAEEMGIFENTTRTKFHNIMKIAGHNPEIMTTKELLAFFNKTMLYKLQVENAENLTHFKLLKEFGKVKIFEVV